MGDEVSDAAADANTELNPSENEDFKVDSLSDEISTSRQIKGEGEQTKKKEKKNSMQNLKTTILVSAGIVALAGVVIVITNKLRQK